MEGGGGGRRSPRGRVLPGIRQEAEEFYVIFVFLDFPPRREERRIFCVLCPSWCEARGAG